MIPLAANWNNALTALLMVCIVIVVAIGLWAMVRTAQIKYGGKK